MKSVVLLVSLCAVFCPALWAADMISSHLGNQGPAFAPGMTPTSLGWGPDDKAYPDKFVVNPKDGAEMTWVPAGQFMMGSSAREREWVFEAAKAVAGDQARRDWFTDERPLHRVRITKGFWLYRHDVTNAQYRKFRADHDSGSYKGLSLNGDRQPVVQVNWDEAAEYCKWAGAQLPTEAQFEYACRAGTRTRTWWGDNEAETGKCANVSDRTLRAQLHPQLNGRDMPIYDTDDGYAVSAPVGSFRPNPLGLYDMLGNVWQWCADWYGADYYAKSPRDDPKGPDTGEYRVYRGGSWYCPPGCARAATRGRHCPVIRDFLKGFRAAVPAQ